MMASFSRNGPVSSTVYNIYLFSIKLDPIVPTTKVLPIKPIMIIIKRKTAEIARVDKPLKTVKNRYFQDKGK